MLSVCHTQAARAQTERPAFPEVEALPVQETLPDPAAYDFGEYALPAPPS